MGKLFDFFSGNNKAGKGITKKQVEFDKKLGFGFFFRLFKMRLGKFSVTNLAFTLCNIGIIIALFGFTGMLDSTVPTATDPLYGQISAASMNDASPVVSSLYGVFCASTGMKVTSIASKVLKCAMFTLFVTFGLATIGMVYNIRNVCTGEHIDTWQDFFYAIKRNFKQGIVISIIDAILVFLLIYNIFAYRIEAANEFIFLVFYYASIVFAVVYYIMRFYVYLQLVTCEMSIWKLYKNALLLTALGIKRNLVCVIGTVVFAILFAYTSILLPQFAIVALCIFVFAFLTYLGIYCAYPVFKLYVIDPYYDEHPEERPEDPWATTESVFVDRG